MQLSHFSWLCCLRIFCVSFFVVNVNIFLICNSYLWMWKLLFIFFAGFFFQLNFLKQLLWASRWNSGKESTYRCRRHKGYGFDSWVGKIPWSSSGNPLQCFLPRTLHGWKDLAVYSLLVYRFGHGFTYLELLYFNVVMCTAFSFIIFPGLLCIKNITCCKRN